jgi:hypothetical protein
MRLVVINLFLFFVLGLTTSFTTSIENFNNNPELTYQSESVFHKDANSHDLFLDIDLIFCADDETSESDKKTLITGKSDFETFSFAKKYFYFARLNKCNYFNNLIIKYPSLLIFFKVFRL